MLKKIPYNSNLINIGNETHKADELVWSDGQVVYGRLRNPQQSVPLITDTNSGFWVGEQDVGGNYKLAQRTLGLGNTVISKEHGENQAYPCYSMLVIGLDFIHTPDGVYRYTGDIVALSGDGKSLCYNNYHLLFNSQGQRKLDSNDRPLCVGIVHVYSDVAYLTHGVYSATDTNTGTIYIYNDNMVEVATYNSGTVHTEDYDGVGSIVVENAYPYYDTVTVDVDLSVLLSLEQNVNRIQVVDGFAYDISHDVLAKTVTKDGLIYVYDSNMQLIAHELGNNEIEVFNSSQQQIYRGIGGIAVYNLIDTGTADLDGDEIYYCSYRAIRATTPAEVVQQQHPYIWYLYTSDSLARKMFQLATTQNCRITANTPDRDNDGSVIYLGDYTFHLTVLITSDSGKIVFKNNLTYAYDNSMNLIAEELGNGNIIVYDAQGSQIYYGLGKIDYYNLQDTGTVDIDGDTIYDGDYVVVKPLSSVPILSGNAESSVSGNDITLYDSNDDIIAQENGTDVTVYEGSNVVYDGPGSITTNMVAVEWSCDYDIRRDVDGSSSKIVSIGGNVYQDSQGIWHIEGGTIQIYNTGSLFAEGPGSGFTGTVTIYYVPTNWTGSGWIDTDTLTPQGTDQQGNQIFSGGYTIRRDITGSGLLRIINNNNVVYDSNHNLIAQESGNQVIVYNQQGGIDWQGYGWIDTTNRVVVRYGGTYNINCALDGDTGSDTLITRDDDIYVYSTPYTQQHQNLIAREDGSELLIGGWHGYGYITISNEDARRSIKQYYIDIQNGVVQQAYPQVVQVDADVSIDTSTMGVDINSNTYAGDALELLQTDDIVYVGGVHSYQFGSKYYMISQDSKKIYKEGNQALESETYQGIENCFSLRWLRNKWK